MKKVLLTGASGFMGSNILPFLQRKHHVYAPKRNELDVRNSIQVKKYLQKGQFDFIVHFASPSPARSPGIDKYETLFEDSMRIFLNFYTNRHLFGKMLYSGSGAEFDKSRDISLISEHQIGECLPADSYGLSKYAINQLASHSGNIYNLRIFACYGPGEYKTKFITHCIRRCLEKKPITIRQDCFFDYIYVDDYARYLMKLMDRTPAFHDYNAASGIRINLSNIAEMVRQQTGNPYPVEIQHEGLNKEYTANASRIKGETGICDLISIESGIAKLIDWEEKQYEATSR